MEEQIEYSEVQKVLKRLLDRLEIVAQEDDEVYEMESKMALSDAIVKGFIFDNPEYTLPNHFGLESEELNIAIKKALQEYIEGMRPLVESYSLDDEDKRWYAFQDLDVDSEGEEDVEEFFDWIEDLDDFR